jgi:hypothetical protein
VRTLFTAADSGLSSSTLKWGERKGRWRRVMRSVYAVGPEPVTTFDRERAKVLAAASPARGGLAGVLLGLDGVELDGRPTRREVLDVGRCTTIGGVRCVDALQALVDLAPLLDDDTWEQALESALRRRLITVRAFDDVPARTRGLPRIHRVLARRPAAAPPTESLLETLALQLARTVPTLGEPTRQLVVTREDGVFVARLDLSWPAPGMFLELDGQGFHGQPVYDARRESAVVAATGWLPVRATWHEVVRLPRSTARRWADIREQCRRRGGAAVA